ncbi:MULTISPECIES: LysR family transcriptional regulator [Pseudomonas]|uniref:LysR family transcriptional regulator n=1 Tax=Pseudomonadaceae TaxID=135621 RepID=UPI00106EE644|nr:MULTISPECIES: LysR family transcriptional regulator [Pseudomonas]
METLSSIECFVRTAEAGSFAEAARRLGLTPAAVGKNVARLESSLGVRLFLRSTRRLTLTEAGERFLAQVSGGLASIQSAVANLASSQGQPAGRLKVSMGVAFGRDYILPHLSDFLARYPAITPDWHFDNRAVDLIGEGFDAAIGGGFELPPGAIARQLAPAHRVLLASPGYLARHAVIRTPEDLARHDGILIRSPQTGRVRSWPLRTADERQATLELNRRMTMNDPEAACHAALQDLGITLVSTVHALPYLQRGELQRVLPDWYVDTGSLSLYFSAQKLLPAKTRVFIDFIVERFREHRWAQRFDARNPMAATTEPPRK